MKRKNLLLCGAILAISLQGLALAADTSAKGLQLLKGKWVLTGEHFCPNVCAMDDAEANSYKGRTIEYTAAQVKAGGETCTAPSYAFETLSLADFSVNYRFQPSKIGLKNAPTYHVSIECQNDDAPSLAYGALIANPNRIFISVEGVFFAARRQ